MNQKKGPSVSAHFNRLMDLVRLEEKEEMQQFREQIVERTPEEREKTGNALLRLRMLEHHFSAGGHHLLSFGYAHGKPLPLFSLDTGDVVALSSEYSGFSNIPIGTVYEKTRESITVAFDWLKPDFIDETCLYELNRSGSRATYKKIYDALEQVRDADHSRAALFRDIRFGVKKASAQDTLGREKLEYVNPFLNKWQQQAVQNVLLAEDVALIHGPPGTGKTTVLVEIIQQVLKEEKFVFAAAPSNTACDNLLECLVKAGVPALRLGHPARIMKHLRGHTLDFKAASHSLAGLIDEEEAEMERLFKKQERARERNSLTREEMKQLAGQIRELKKDIQSLESQIISQILEETPVMVGTLASGRDFFFRNRKVDLLVIDEATQATEALSWVPLLRAEKIVLAGDHFQLPPTVRSKEAEAQGLGASLFEKFHKALPEEMKPLLRVQYRMHEKIMNFSSREFYEGKLIADASVAAHCLAELPHVTAAPATSEVLLFLDTAGRGFEEQLEEGSESRYNRDEAELVMKELQKLLDHGVKPEEIALIGPYSAQVRLLASMTENLGVEVDSVDGFQGREKEAVIVSLVRSNLEGELGFLSDTRRMNVAMTRARRKLIVIGDSATLSSIPFYRNFIQYAESIQAYRSSWEEV